MPLALVPVAVAVAVGALVFRSEVAPSQARSSARNGAPLSAVVLQHGQDTGGSASAGSNAPAAAAVRLRARRARLRLRRAGR